MTNSTDITEKADVLLTQFAHGAGCGCKIAPAVLDKILQKNSVQPIYPQLLVGNATADDAAVYDMGNGNCLISTTDFFTPIVDDAYDFGRIAAANAISDVYAMGGTPIMALAVLGWPVEKLPAELAAKVLEGARATCAIANIPLAGGHSIDSPEPFFGLSVNGMVPLTQLKQNSTAQAGDVLLLTKALGTGILSTSMKRGHLKQEHYTALVEQLTRLNSVGIALGGLSQVHAITDVTGFGLLGHLIEMAEGSQLKATLFYDRLPVMEGVKEYLALRLVPDATYRNWNSYSKKVKFQPGVNVMEAFSLLPDPQTNGGLLIAVKPDMLEAVVEVLNQAGLSGYTIPIGHLHETGENVITVMQSP